MWNWFDNYTSRQYLEPDAEKVHIGGRQKRKERKGRFFFFLEEKNERQDRWIKMGGKVSERCRRWGIKTGGG
jgi:hypothetical protein